MPQQFLVPKKRYLASGIHIGMKQKTKDMKEFIYKIRGDGLAILDLQKIDERIRVAAKFLARCKNIVAAGRRAIVHKPLQKFGEIVGAKVVTGRFLPGMLTNPKLEEYTEADVVFISDPITDEQALNEAVKARVPVVALCDTINETKNVDLIIPCNNKGRKSLALIYWLLAREILKERGEIKTNASFKYTVEDFMSR